MVRSMTAPEDDSTAADARNKFLVIADDCEEARLAAFFAGRRAKRSGARVALLHVIEPPEFGHWAAVAETIRAEAQDTAQTVLGEFAAEVKAQAGEAPEIFMREGRTVDEIRTLIDKDPKIALLFLGASTKASGPGPLVEALAHRPDYLSGRPIPVVVVPGSVTRDELRQLSG